MPTHRRMPLMYSTLVSVFTQHYDDFEFIVVDASDDFYFKDEIDNLFKNTELLRQNSDKLEKTKIVYPEKNKKYPGAMKMEGFTHCKQDDDFVIFLDHDDFLGQNLFKYIALAKEQYPDTEMISTKYTNLVYSDNQILTSLETYAGGTKCESSNVIYIGDMYYSFGYEQDIYKNVHPFKAMMCPKIMSKKLIRDKRFEFVQDTGKIDDVCWPIMSHSFIETYIPIVGYVYVGYNAEFSTNSCDPYIEISETTQKYGNICHEYEIMLNDIGYKKQRNEIVL